ncbi:MAG TPA: RNB domain-containing ribonuclease [Steroidobacteraceae bacterium]|nr:RNB domain-containing ribonuclease [Steroidobacteraceae bacterium]
MTASRHTARADLGAIARQAMLERGLLPDFSREAQAQADAARPAAADSGVRDLRHLPWLSIDNDDSRDLDQIAAAEPASGGTRMRVAIADVDALVKSGSPIDVHARQNTTSVYAAGRIFPMLPERLCYDLTSLVQGAERLAVVIDMLVTDGGRVTATDLYRALVLNRAKLAYDAVAAWLQDGAAPPPALAAAGLEEQLRLQDRVAAALGTVRHERGALTLATIQTSAVFDGEALRDLVPDHKNRAHELIENQMVAANGAVALWLQQRGLPSIRRILRTPRKWDRIVALAAESGSRLPATPDPAALNAFLAARRAADPVRFPDLSLAVIKLLGRGEYALEMPGHPIEGHFGLAVDDYLHSTAPNRRYPDLITQRLVKAVLAAVAPPYTAADLQSLAQHCTQQEDNAAKVERRVGKSAAALLLATRLGEVFDAIVTGAAETGTWARTLAPPVEGRVIRGFQGLEVGERVRVRLVHTDVERGFIDFACEARP